MHKAISGAVAGDSNLQDRGVTHYLLCLLFSLVSLPHNNSDFICTPIAPPATSAPSYEIKPALLNLVMKAQFSGAGEDAALHLNNFVELCDMQ